MASSSTSRTVSDEEVQKAREDLKGILAGVPDEFKCHVDFGGKEKAAEEKKEGKKKKKKKVVRARPEEVECILNFKPKPLPIFRTLAEADKRDNEMYKELRAACSAIDVLVRNSDDLMRVHQEIIRQKLETKGYVEYEVTDDEEEEDIKGVTMASQLGHRGGRSRTPHGVTKLPRGGVKKTK